MATVFWIGNALARAQVISAQVTAVAAGGTLTATINTKAITYTATASDTIATAVAAWLALLSNQSIAPPEMNELTWISTATDTITATASIAGTPFSGMTNGLVFSAAGGCTVVQATVTTNSSPSDVIDANNWLRAGVRALPQNGDDMVIADSSVPLLWNLSGLSTVRLNSYVRWQSFTATIGLPQINPNGYYEFRPIYFKLNGPSGSSSSSPGGSGGTNILTMQIGIGTNGGGPSRELYDVQGQQTNFVILASGGAADTYAIRLLGTNVSNTLTVLGTSVGVATWSGELAALASATVDGGGTLALGSGVTLFGTLNVVSGTATLDCAPTTLNVYNGSSVAVTATGLTWATVNANMSSSISWRAGGAITNLVLASGASLDKSGDARALTIANSTIDGDTCQILDPLNAITYTNATVVKNLCNSGPFTFGTGRTVKIV